MGVSAPFHLALRAVVGSDEASRKWQDPGLFSSESRYSTKGIKSVLWSQTSKCDCWGQIGLEEAQKKIDYLQEGG